MMEFDVPSNNFSLIGLRKNRKIIPPCELRVHETMGGARVDKGGETDGGDGDTGRGERDMEGVQVGKSRRIESDYLQRCTGRVNAVLSLCRGLRAA